MIELKTAALALAIGGVSMAGLGAAWAHGHGGFRGAGHRELVHKFVDFAVNEKLDEIGATDVQKQKVNDIKARLVKEAQALHAGRKETHEELLGLLAQDNPDTARIKALVRERTEAVSRLGDDAADAIVELHGVFTPEQRQKLIAAAREHMARHCN